MIITNNSNIPLSLAVWCVHDEYDYINTPNYISATSLMKPVKQSILPRLIPSDERVVDVDSYISRALGHSLHDSIEKAWVKGYARNLKKLGYPDDVIARVLVNPEPEDIKQDSIPIYLEKRGYRELDVDGVTYTIGGKFDMVAEGIVHDNKSTTAFTWVHGTKDDDYRLQGSLYKWIHPEIITEDFIRICFIFTDWQRASARQNPKYPQSRLEHKDIPLMSEADTEEWVRAKIRELVKNQDAEQDDMPECTDDELWMSAPVYKYYSDATKTTGKSTKNFDNPLEARDHLISKQGKGVVITIKGEPKRCGYCDAAPICNQHKRMLP